MSTIPMFKGRIQQIWALFETAPELTTEEVRRGCLVAHVNQVRPYLCELEKRGMLQRLNQGRTRAAIPTNKPTLWRKVMG